MYFKVQGIGAKQFLKSHLKEFGSVGSSKNLFQILTVNMQLVISYANLVQNLNLYIARKERVGLKSSFLFCLILNTLHGDFEYLLHTQELLCKKEFPLILLDIIDRKILNK